MPRKPPCLPAERSVGFRPKFPAPPSGSAKMIRQTTAPNKMIVPPQRRYWPPSGVAKILALRFYHLACCCRQFSCLLARELVLFFLQHTKGKQVSRNEDEEVSGNEDGEVSRNEDEEYKDDGGNQDEDDDGGHQDEDKVSNLFRCCRISRISDFTIMSLIFYQHWLGDFTSMA